MEDKNKKPLEEGDRISVHIYDKDYDATVVDPDKWRVLANEERDSESCSLPTGNVSYKLDETWSKYKYWGTPATEVTKMEEPVISANPKGCNCSSPNLVDSWTFNGDPFKFCRKCKKEKI